MNPLAMEPFGRALLAWFEGDRETSLIMRRDDDLEFLLPVGHFFRDPADFTPLEKKALASCRGLILDIGAGAGSHSLALQSGEQSVLAIDIDPLAVTVMERRGVTHSRCADVYQFTGGPFDTLLMLGHGIGMAETLDGLNRFLKHAPALLSPGGRLLLDSLDVRATADPIHLAYHEANRRMGKYIGEISIRFEFRDQPGPFAGWLQVDAETLQQYASETGWQCKVIHTEPSGDYLACLTREP